MDPKPPPPPQHSSAAYTNFPILAVSILGILTTAILLLSYYIFVIKCCLNWRRPDLHLLLLRRSRTFRTRHFTTAAAAAAAAATNPTSEPRGLDISTINSIPAFRFSKSTTISVECAVCISDFRDQELLRLLPNCAHAFHIDCIDTWLQFNPNCPLCRAEISPVPTNQFGIAPQPAELHSSSSSSSSSPSSSSVVIEIRDNHPAEQQRATPKAAGAVTKMRRFWHMASMGDECIDIREKDERFDVQPIRRSFSMDSSNDRHLYVSVQEILRQNPRLFQEVRNGEGSSSGSGGGSGGNGSGRIRRSFFTFGRSSRSAAAVCSSGAE